MSVSKGWVVLVGVLACGQACAGDTQVAAATGPAKKTVAEVIPITVSNLRGHEALYKEGWRIVSSSERAFSYAKQHAIVSSREAIREALADVSKDSAQYGTRLSEAGKGGVKTGAEVYQSAHQLGNAELAATGALVKAEWDYGAESWAAGWQRIVQGRLTLAERTEDDWQALKAVPWYKGLYKDLSNLHALTKDALKGASPHIESDWSGAAAEARADFEEAYRKSGTRNNSLAGVGDMLVGYVSVIYSGLVKPSSRTAAVGAEAVGKTAAKAVFLPTATAFMVSGRTIESVGLTVYYTTSMGVKLVSPTVEGGLLMGLSILSYGSIPVTAVAGGAVGVANQVAVAPTAGVAAGAGRGAIEAGADTGVYAAQVSYDVLAGTTKVTINQAASGVVLGYNALTALPTQLLMGAVNGAMFLAYDGPRLVVASAKGEVQWSDDKGEKRSVPVESLPVGSVVDLKALKKEPGVQVQVISDDPEVVQKVLEKLPDDLRERSKP